MGDATELQERRASWLQRHDQSTGGLSGLLPLLPHMPVRLTHTVPALRKFNLFKNSRGTLYSWTLDPEDMKRIEHTTEPECVLRKLPQALYVQIADATWQQHPSMPPGVVCIYPMVQAWSLESKGRATVSRRAFPLACDLAGTAHSFMGATLSACTVDLGFWHSVPTQDSQLSGYMCLSRVKRSEDLCVTQMFSPQLFTQGELVGPDALLRFHVDRLTETELRTKFDAEKPRRRRHFTIMLPCGKCGCATDGSEILQPLEQFLPHNEDDPVKVLQQGMRRMCASCVAQETANKDEVADVHVSKSHPCGFCNVVLLAAPGFCADCKAKKPNLTCVRCKAYKPLAAFAPEEIRRKKAAKELRAARCLRCVAAAEQATQKVARVRCRECQQLKSRSAMRTWDSASQSGVCRPCLAKANSHNQPTKQNPKSACPVCNQGMPRYTTPGSWCEACAYPPCARCRTTPRPKKGALHAKKKGVWICKTCISKPCAQCGKQVLDQAKAETYCAQCAYPPCDGRCGRLRPNHQDYHVTVLPRWICNICAAASPSKPCAKCGRQLPTTTKSASWCNTCAFPPCDNGCGHARPTTHHKYHAKNLPIWVCPRCRLQGAPEPSPPPAAIPQPRKRSRRGPAPSSPDKKQRHD